MIPKFIFILFLVSLNYNCNINSNHSDTDKETNFNHIQEISTKENSSNISELDHFKIDTVSAIFYESSDKIIDSLKQLNKSIDEFEQVVMDNQFYMSQIEEFMNKLRVKVIHTDSNKFSFINRQGRQYNLFINSNFDGWGVVLFNGVDSPFVLNKIVDDENDILKYYGLKIGD